MHTFLQVTKQIKVMEVRFDSGPLNFWKNFRG